MNGLVVFALLILFISSGFQSVYAEIFFPSNNFRQNEPSTYCILEPSENISENQGQWVTLVNDAVSDWESSLKDAETENDNLWKMNQKVITDENDDDCDIIIKFKDKPDLLDSVAGFFAWPPGNIAIYYLEYKLCNAIVACYEDGFFKSNDMIYAIALHEIGHSLGLDHYVSDDNSLNGKWQTANTSPPSVMIPSLHNNPSLLEITDIDVQKVRSIYGSDGFYAFADNLPSPSPTPVPTPVPTPTPEPVPAPLPKVKPIIPIKPFDGMQISHKVIEVESYDREIVTISGQIAEEEFFRGQPVIITIHKPDHTVDVLKIKTTGAGYFDTLLIFDKNSMRGIYHISASYVYHVDKDMDITFEVVSKKIDDKSKSAPNDFESMETVQNKIPVWVKNNAKWWISGERGQEGFVSGIQYLVEHKIIEISDVSKSSNISKEIPPWVKNIAEFWANDMIGDEEFIFSIQYLVKNQIINP